MSNNEFNAEIRYRLGEFILIEMVRSGEITDGEFVELRDKLLDVCKPVIAELERGLPCGMRKTLK